MWCIGRLTEEYRQRMYDLLVGRPPVSSERAGRLPGREEQAGAERYSPTLADEAWDTLANGL